MWTTTKRSIYIHISITHTPHTSFVFLIYIHARMVVTVYEPTRCYDTFSTPFRCTSSRCSDQIESSGSIFFCPQQDQMGWIFADLARHLRVCLCLRGSPDRGLVFEMADGINSCSIKTSKRGGFKRINCKFSKFILCLGHTFDYIFFGNIVNFEYFLGNCFFFNFLSAFWKSGNLKRRQFLTKTENWFHLYYHGFPRTYKPSHRSF